MAICYLCGLEMVERPDYEAVARGTENHPAIKHAEHILQNALFGRLKSREILCESCGSQLSQEIDSEFIKPFDSFTTQIRHILAAKDHGANTQKSLRGHIVTQKGKQIQIQVRNGKVQPMMPFYEYDPDEKTVKIYGDAKTTKHYKNRVKTELTAAGINFSTLKIDLLDDIKDYVERGIYFSEGMINFDNSLKLGLSKIAVGFAVYHGIPRDQLQCSLDIGSQKIILSDNVIPFFPIGTFDYYIEPFRIALEPEFPSHTILLYTDNTNERTKLVCYIDLFSTFQFYVILNQDYKGPKVSQTYYQTILRQELPDVDVKAVRWKYLPLVAEQLGISKDEYRGFSIDEIRSLLDRRLRQATQSYVLNFNATFRKLSSRVVMDMIMRRKTDALQTLPEIERDILLNLPDFEIEELLIMHHEMRRVDESHVDGFYRQTFIDSDANRNVYVRSTLEALVDHFHESGLKTFQDYGHVKFHLLSHFVQLNS